MLLHRDRFVNPQHDLDCPSGGVSFWTTCQGDGDMGEIVASTEGAIMSLDGANVRHEEVTSTMQTKLAVVVGPLKTTTEMGTYAYVLHSTLRGEIPVVEALPPLVDWIDRNRTEWVFLVAEQETMTRFAYNVS